MGNIVRGWKQHKIPEEALIPPICTGGEADEGIGWVAAAMDTHASAKRDPRAGWRALEALWRCGDRTGSCDTSCNRPRRVRISLASPNRDSGDQS